MVRPPGDIGHPDRLLEREGELALVDALIAAAAAGEARVALVEGAAGIGKSRLLAEARARAAQAGFDSLTARGGELEREFPFGVVRQLFEPRLADAGMRARALAGAAASAREVFELVGGDEEVDASFAALHGLYWLTANLAADGPLLIVVDDLHWCDSPSLRFMAYLERRLEGLPVLVACSLRPAEPGADSALLGEVAADPLVVRLLPGPLGEGGVGELVAERLGGPPDGAFVAATHAATNGNPLLLHELLRTLRAEGVRPDAAHVRTVSDIGPRAASRAVLVRLAHLPASAVAIARAASVLGDGADLTTVIALAGVGEEHAPAGMAALLRAEIMRAEPRAEFVHPLVGAAIYRDITPLERTVAHERAARILAERAAPVEQVAAQLLATPGRGDPWVVETLRSAARAALRKGGAENAVACLTRALAEPPPSHLRTQLVLELGLAEALTNGPAAVEHLTDAYESHPAADARARAAQALARTLINSDRLPEAAAIASRAASELSACPDDVRWTLEAYELIAETYHGGGQETARRLEPFRARPVGARVGAKMLAAVATQEWAYAGGTAEACAGLALDALAGGTLIEVDNGFSGIVALSMLVLADRAEARDVLELSLELAHRHGSLLAKSTVSWARAYALHRWGELAEAEREARAAIEEITLWTGSSQVGNVYNTALLAAVQRDRGRLTEARRTFEHASDPGDRSDRARIWLDTRLELLVAEARYGEALVVADEFRERFGYLPNPFDTPWRQHKALALDAAGRRSEALALAREDLTLARGWGAPGTVARSLRVLGTLERERGIEHLREAVAVAASSPARLEHARALGALGTALRHDRRPSEARKPLRQAHELARVSGAEGLAEHLRSELTAAGGRPRATAFAGVDGLTASERRVAALAAKGRTNRDIAQALFVTPKTVEVHLSNAYRKLEIRSRRELQHAMRGGA